MTQEEYNKQFMEWLEFFKNNPIDGSMDSCDETIKPIEFTSISINWVDPLDEIPGYEDIIHISRQININKMIDILLDHKNQGYEEVEFTMDDDEIMIEGVDNE